MEKLIMAIDQGTTGSTVSLVNLAGKQVAKINKEFPQYFPKPAWVEHDLNEIWQSIELAMKKLFETSKYNSRQVAAIGITNQRETVGAWRRDNSKPLHRAIVWQCRRTTDFCKKNSAEQAWIKRKTGLVLDPYFSGSKINWLLKKSQDVKEQARNNNLAVGTMDSFLVWKLTQGQSHVTDVSNASRTMLMDLKTLKWDEKLLKFFKVKESILPQIRSSAEVYGHTKGLQFLPDGIPISGIAGDQQAALFGQACFKPGEAKCTYGTGSFLLMNTGADIVKSKSGLLTTVAWKIGEETHYALEGSAFICGAAVQWLRDQLKFIERSCEIEDLARKCDDAGGVEFVPSFTGLGSPYWNPEARAMIKGLTRGSGRSEIARACLEGMALQNVDLLKAMEKDSQKKLRLLKVDGGACSNDLLMQLQTDYLGSKVVRPKMVETTALGAAYLAGLGAGLWTSKKAIKEVWKVDKEFQPNSSSSQRKKRLASWHRAIKSL
ncbi:MAG: glycerol kinase GlpK [Bdellovibrionales bacterium]